MAKRYGNTRASTTYSEYDGDDDENRGTGNRYERGDVCCPLLPNESRPDGFVPPGRLAPEGP